MNCDEVRELFTDALYGELTDAGSAAFEGHLESCGSCRREFDGLKRTLEMMSRRTRTEPTDAEWADFSRKLEDRLRDETVGQDAPATARRKRAGVFALFPAFRPAWAYGIAAALLVAFGVYMGRTFFNGDTGPAAPSPGIAGGERTAPGTAAGAEALAYLERSRNLLLGLTNLSDEQAAAVDLERSRRVSRELYDRGNALAVALNRPSQQQLRQLVQGLQVILLQLSNMDAGDGTPVIEMVRKGVDSKSILLKINLEAIRAALNEDIYRPADAGDRNRL